MKSASKLIERAYDKDHIEKSLYGNSFVVSRLYDRGAAWITVRDSIAVRGRRTRPSLALRALSRSWNMKHSVLTEDNSVSARETLVETRAAASTRTTSTLMRDKAPEHDAREGRQGRTRQNRPLTSPLPCSTGTNAPGKLIPGKERRVSAQVEAIPAKPMRQERGKKSFRPSRQSTTAPPALFVPFLHLVGGDLGADAGAKNELRRLPTATNLRNLLRSRELVKRHEAIVGEWYPRGQNRAAVHTSCPRSSSPSSPFSPSSPPLSPSSPRSSSSPSPPSSPYFLLSSTSHTEPPLQDVRAKASTGRREVACDDEAKWPVDGVDGGCEGAEGGSNRGAEDEDNGEDLKLQSNFAMDEEEKRAVHGHQDHAKQQAEQQDQHQQQEQHGHGRQEQEQEQEQEQGQGQEQERNLEARAISIAMRLLGQKLLEEGKFEMSSEVMRRSNLLLEENAKRGSAGGESLYEGRGEDERRGGREEGDS